MNLRSSDALQVVKKLALAQLQSGQTHFPDAESEKEALESIHHLDKMIQCLKDGKRFFACVSQD